jgi:anaerobic ribonucleoside-triphosphate reductase activating protein
MTSEIMQMDFYAKTQQQLSRLWAQASFEPRHFFYNNNVVLQEVPDEITICFNISGCPIGCPGCSWKNTTIKPRELTRELYTEILTQNTGLASCIAFMGGEWKRAELIALLTIAKSYGFKTCLYTGQTTIDVEILKLLNFIKLGPWRANLGGLDSKETNQAFFKLENLNHIFQKGAKQ